MTRTCAVTGATGFLGRALVRALFAEDWRVRVLARRDPVAAFGEVDAEVVIGGLRSAPLAELCRGAEVLIHVAGLVKARGRAEFDAANVEGARQAALAAKASGARMVLISSLAAREPQLSHYAASKRAGEAAVLSVLGEDSPSRLSIIRPPAIYGPGDRETLAIFQFASRSPVLPVFDARARIAMIHVEDAARQIVAAATLPPERRCIAISDARRDGYGWNEIVDAAAWAVEKTPRKAHFPSAALNFAGAVGSLACVFGARPMLTAGKARELRWLDWSLKSDEAWPEAPQAKFALREGFRQTISWWRETQGLSL